MVGTEGDLSPRPQPQVWEPVGREEKQLPLQRYTTFYLWLIVRIVWPYSFRKIQVRILSYKTLKYTPLLSLHYLFQTS